jgi:hypothetical protein
MKRALLIITIALVISSGCAMLYDQWPAKHPQDTKNYVGEDPNGLYPTLGQLKDMREAAITKHILSQIDHKHEMEKDKASYGRAIEQANLYIASAVKERQEMIGTIQNPGWLMGALIGLTGVGAYMTGARKQRPEDWSPEEHEAAVEEAVVKAANGGR